jgi:hypothetical protein
MFRDGEGCRGYKKRTKQGITSVNLKDYIRGERHGKEANRLEREAMEDPFLQGAIDGYDSVEGDHYSVIQKLERQLAQPRKRVSRRIWIAAAAALLLLLIGIPFLLHPPQPTVEPLVATTDTRVEKEIVTEKALEKRAVEEHKVLEMAQVVEAAGSTRTTKASDEQTTEAVEVAHLKQHEVTVQEEKEEQLAEAQASSEGKQGHVRVSGRILDEQGWPLTGVTISVENSNRGVVTDTDGKFSLSVPEDEKRPLIASFIGMHNETIPLKENVGDITMKEDAALLSEVVVVAFGTQKKESVVGSTAAAKQDSSRTDDKALDQRGKEETDQFKVDEATTVAFSRRDAKAIEPGKKDTETKAFGEKEFKKFFAKHYDKSLCQGDSIAFTVTFSIRPDGRPTGIQIQENSCPDLETEIKRLLLGSPPWTNTNRKVTLTVEIPGS